MDDAAMQSTSGASADLLQSSPPTAGDHHALTYTKSCT